MLENAFSEDLEPLNIKIFTSAQTMVAPHGATKLSQLVTELK